VFGAGLEAGNCVDDAIYGSLGAVVTLAFEDGVETFVAEHFAFRVDGVDDAVGEEDDDIAGLCGEGELFVLGVGEESQGEPLRLDGAYVRPGGGVGDEDGLHGAGVGDLQGLVRVVPDGHQHGDVLGVELALLQLVVEGGEHGGGG